MAAATLPMVLSGLVGLYVFLRLLLHATQDPNEPPTIETAIPFLAPVIGMVREKSRYYPRLRDKHRLPIYTLRMPFSRMYVVNTPELIPALQRNWRTISFAAVAADAGTVLGMSQESREMMHSSLLDENGFMLSAMKRIASAMAPGEDLNTMDRRAIEILSQETERLRAKGTSKVGLWEWTRQVMVVSTTEAVWGPKNPYRNKAVTEAWGIFESGFMTLNVFPRAAVFFPKLIRAREVLAAALIRYTRECGQDHASGLVRARYEHHVNLWGLSPEDFGRGELGDTFAVLGNTVPCALWVLYHVFSDDQVLADIRREVEAIVQESQDSEGASIKSIDLASVTKSCPVLLSTFQETMRYRAVAPGARILLEDVLLDGRYHLKKGSMLMIPVPVQHTDTLAWGDTVGEFDHLRFIRKPGPGTQKLDKRAFRAFGGGHVLCPGRHFASDEIIALTALLVLQFDVVPIVGQWIEPTWENSPLQAGFPVPDQDIDVEMIPRDPATKWKITFSDSDETPGIVSEDISESKQ